jgi:hypothetical protein
MAFITALFIVLFKISALIFFGYVFYTSKGWLKKTIVFILFLFYCSLFLPIFIMRLGDSYGNSSRHGSDSSFISDVESHLNKIQGFFENIGELTMGGLKDILPNGLLPAILFLILFGPIITFSFSHFILNFVYFMFFCLLWAVFLRPKIEATVEAITENNKDGHQEKDLPTVQKDRILLSILKEIFKK